MLLFSRSLTEDIQGGFKIPLCANPLPEFPELLLCIFDLEVHLMGLILQEQPNILSNGINHIPADLHEKIPTLWITPPRLFYPHEDPPHMNMD